VRHHASEATAMRELFPLLLQGTLVTIEIAALGTLLAIAMAFVATAAKLAPWAPVRWIGNVYVEVFRGTSLLVQLFWFFFVLPLPPFRIELTPFTVATSGLACTTARTARRFCAGRCARCRAASSKQPSR
jgi:His/Glu/Gln/Arg/opine family amino acid ABC transporter permease subunit